MSLCPVCRRKARVLETREAPRATRRRRECRSCGHRFTTYEVIEPPGATEAAEIAYEVGEMGTRLDVIGDQIADLPADLAGEVAGEVVEAILAEAGRQSLDGHRRLALTAGDDDEDE